MKKKKFVITYIFVLLSLLVSCAIFDFVVDPFFNYRIPENPIGYHYDQEYSPTWKIGMSKHQYGFDSIWVGSSLSSHIDISYLDDTLTKKCTTGIVASGRPNIYKIFIDNAIKTSNISTVYYEAELAHWMWEYMGTEYDMSYVPEYVQTDSILDDGSYLFNIDVLKQAFMDCVDHNIAMNQINHLNSSGESENEINEKNNESEINRIIPKDQNYSIRIMEPSVASNVTSGISNEDITHFGETGINNIQNNIIPLIQNNSNIHFVFVEPPTSVVFINQLYNSGLLDTYLSACKNMLLLLLQFDNVSVYATNLDVEFNTNLDHYMDSGHFEPQGAYLEIDFIKNNKYEITEVNIDEMMNQYIEMARNFEWPFIKENFQGQQVEKLQSNLVLLGYPVEINGIYDSNTKEAVIDLQQKSGIEVNGIVFEDTFKIIEEKLSTN